MGDGSADREQAEEMNIQQAKQEIGNTLRAYHRKDAQGNFCFPRIRQRPIFLMGPPGIGKTAILEQIAQENGVGLVAYSLTHHTRQSAVGLPQIQTQSCDGQQVQITRYTMSEIVGAVYGYMEKSGQKEGILFLDEVNCVSETLAPTMLQLLQNKTFGTHRIPDGWILVTAGNPPAYNKSVRELDMATLDRVRTLEIEPDCDAWLEYARSHGIHGSILAYLTMKPEQFYRVEDRPEGKLFVTARGWEDLSELLKSYEVLEIPVSQDVIREYLQMDCVAQEFSAYYHLYRKYAGDYDFSPVLEGEDWSRQLQMAQAGGFEERFTVIRLLLDMLSGAFDRCCRMTEQVEYLYTSVVRLRDSWGEGPGALAQGQENSLQVLMENNLISHGEQVLRQWGIEKLRSYSQQLKENYITDSQVAFEWVRELFYQETKRLDSLIEQTGCSLKHALRFSQQCFGQGQETVLLLTELSHNKDAMTFITENGSPEFLNLSHLLLHRKQEEKLQEACRKFLENS